MNNHLIDVLRKHDLNITKARVNILALFLAENAGLTYGVIKKGLGPGMTKSTIYRTLHAFIKKGLVHCIPTAGNLILYSLSQNAHEQQQPAEVNFICLICGKIHALHDIKIPGIHLPENFTIRQRHMVIKGRCSNCIAEDTC
jgi:Fur family ferric uptake transcriptional regulator